MQSEGVAQVSVTTPVVYPLIDRVVESAVPCVLGIIPARVDPRDAIRYRRINGAEWAIAVRGRAITPGRHRDNPTKR